ncbi:MAG: Peptide chain release factor 2 [Alphaproteobacteria bacterium MarineAlpha6_Bin4]|nr:MAG: Peptide chain release factor 2 [Alphaproteobacteria bacterium MarineAlpha6_Bin4]
MHRLKLLGGVFDPEYISNKVKSLENMIQKENFWIDKEKAEAVIKEKNILENRLNSYLSLEKEYNELNDLIKITNDDDGELILEISKNTNKLIEKVRKKEFENFLSGEADSNSCFLEVHSGAGGVEAQDWAEMIVRMYTRWCEKKRFSFDILEENSGEEAGIKSLTMKIDGDYAYGWLKKESGIHRLVRISPFDSNSRRHTSFASVWVYPVIDKKIEVNINDKDLRIDTYRASGAGGQHVNKTDSAVRITHIPTKIVVQCQNNRSQHKNKSTALTMLKARIYEMELQKKESEEQSKNQSKSEIGWGRQIRSYVMHPYKMVKDLRNNKEISNCNSVLDGNIDAFLEAALFKKN